jgi:signal peptidase I
VGGLGRVVAAVLVPLAIVVGALAARSAFAIALVDGSSMRPALEPADVLVMERHPGTVGRGDVVVFKRPGWPGGVAHRVVALLPGGLLATRGDANPVGDRDPVARAALIGRVVGIVRTGVVARDLALRARAFAPQR